jgi:Zn-dependent protease
MISLLFTSPLLFITLVSALLLSLSLHELAHAFVAYKLGDPTAKMSGRLTFNPLAHLNPVGTLMLLFAGFGWAKPVPVNSQNLHNPKRDLAIISFAGPLSNFILASLSALLLHFVGFSGGILTGFLYYFAFYNVGLGLFNLFPVAPLDGFKVVSGILPRNLAYQWEQLAPYGIFILLFLILTNSLGRILFPLMGFVLGLFGLSF